jgi:YbdK family carboxylate-amine ligase
VLGGPREAAHTAGGITLGVEEEFVLLNPSTGAAVLAGPDLARMLDGEPGIQREVMRFQVETATRVCTSPDDVGRELIRLRRLAADAAASAGCLLVATGIAPYRTPGLTALTEGPRYRELARNFGPQLAGAGGACGCHVHVGVPSRDLGVQVLARLRPWLAPLLAITVNSPIAHGRDTAWASCRYPAWSRWPTASVAGAWPDAAAYDAAVRRLIGRGAALDEQGIYFPARLSPRYPTVEIRVADVCLDAGAAVLLAGLTRALVVTAGARRCQRHPPRGSMRPFPPRPGTGSPGPPSTRSPGRPPTRAACGPASSITSTPRSATTATRRRSPGCYADSTTTGPEPTASEPCSPAARPGPGSSGRSLARRYHAICNRPPDLDQANILAQHGRSALGDHLGEHADRVHC